MGRVEGKVAFITGAARGQGRSHAIHLAREGADIIATDICGPTDWNNAPPSTEEDLAETVRQVEALGRRIVARRADVRKFDELKAAVDDGVRELGRLDIVCANAGLWTFGRAHELAEAEWKDILDIVLTGVWQTCRATIPTLIEQGQGGSIVITSSTLGLKGAQNMGHYVSAKHGTVGLMRTLAVELGPQKIRVNTVNPGTVNTLLIQNKPTYRLFGPDFEDPKVEDVIDRFSPLTAMGIPWVEPEDVSYAVLYLASDESRYVTGTTLSIDGGGAVL